MRTLKQKRLPPCPAVSKFLAEFCPPTGGSRQVRICYAGAMLLLLLLLLLLPPICRCCHRCFCSAMLA
jgi:hypothetical protein